jgi:hypothetical protein
MKNYAIVFVTILVTLVSGCAAVKPPALAKTTNQLDLSKESIVVLSLRVGNKFKPSYQPNLDYMYFEEISPEAGKIHKYAVNLYKSENEKYNEYLVSMQLHPGKYKFVTVPATSGIFPIRGTFNIPFNYEFAINPSEVAYLGNFEAYIEQKATSNDSAAGPFIPLIDQAVSGASGGTFKLAIKDNFMEAVRNFRTEYPVLNKYPIKNTVIKPL